MENPVTHISYGLVMILRSMMSLIRGFQLQLAALEKTIFEPSETIAEVRLLESIPGVGTKLATSIITESQFQHSKQLVAYAGLDPIVFSSRIFMATQQNRIAKRGSKRWHRAVYLAVTCGLRANLNLRIREYYDKKKVKGKPNKVVVLQNAPLDILLAGFTFNYASLP